MYNLLWKEKACFWYIQVRSGKGLEWEKPSPLPSRWRVKISHIYYLETEIFLKDWIVNYFSRTRKFTIKKIILNVIVLKKKKKRKRHISCQCLPKTEHRSIVSLSHACNLPEMHHGGTEYDQGTTQTLGDYVSAK